MTSTFKNYDQSPACSQTQNLVITKQLSITQEKFSQMLSTIDGNTLCTTNTARMHSTFRMKNGTIKITCKRIRDRRLGSLSIPVLEVDIDLTKCEPSEIGAFKSAFDQALLKLVG